MKIQLCLSLLILAANVHADERIRPHAVLLREGYRVQLFQKGPFRGEIPFPAHSLNWPVKFQDESHQIGNSMAEFQPFGSPYFHGGCDLRVRAGEAVYSPVAGKVVAGHYSYDNNPDGSMVKHWIPWPKPGGDPVYFEVGVITAENFRFEFHHMDERHLPAQIIQLLKHGGGQISAGTLLGQAIHWPSGDYHHVHYNVITPNGVRINPEYVSPLLKDTATPVVQGIWAILKDGSVKDFGSGVFGQAPKEFVVASYDQMGEYSHPPILAWIKFETGQTVGWNFTEALARADGSFPPIFDFFKDEIRTPEGQTFSTDGGYGTGVSLIRLAVPKGATGRFEIQLGDQAGNIFRQPGSLP